VGGAYVPTVVVGMYAPFGVVGLYHTTICMPCAFIVARWHVEDPTMGAYIATTGVATYAPPANASQGHIRQECRRGAKPSGKLRERLKPLCKAESKAELKLGRRKPPQIS
jgi:hypothetical protein